MWQLLDVISLQPAAVKKIREPTLHYKGTFSRQGAAATFIMPDPLTPIPLDPPCMPSLRPFTFPLSNAQAVPPDPTPSTADHAPAHMPTSAPDHVVPGTTTTAHHPSTVAAETQPVAQGDNEAPSSMAAQQGSALQPISVPLCQGLLATHQAEPHHQASYLAQQKAPLQHDPVVQGSEACQEADLVLTEGAYECLTATGLAPGYRGDWEIPFTVQCKLRQVGADPKAPSDVERHQQQVLLDMPLPKRLLNLREKHEMLYQHAVCQMGCSLSSQIHEQQEAAEAAAGEAGVAAETGELQQQEGVDEMLTDDDEMRPRSPSGDQPGTMPYSPSQNAPYSPSNDTPYSPGNGKDASQVHSMTGLTENSSLMPQQPQPAAITPSDPDPTPPHPQHDLSTNDTMGASLFAQAASQGGSMAQEVNRIQPASQSGLAAQEGGHLHPEKSRASSAEPLPAALPAAASDAPWSAMDTDASDAPIGHAAADTRDAAAQDAAAHQHIEADTAAAEDIADFSVPSGSHIVHNETSYLTGCNAQHGDPGKADNAQHGDPGKADNAQHGEAGLRYSSYRLGGYSLVARAQLPLTVPPKPPLRVRLCNQEGLPLQ